MAINIFEGARRISKLILVLIAIVGIFLAYEAYERGQKAKDAVIPSVNADEMPDTKGFDPDAYLAKKETSGQKAKDAVIPSANANESDEWAQFKEASPEETNIDEYAQFKDVLPLVNKAQPVEDLEALYAQAKPVENNETSYNEVLEILGITTFSMLGFWIFCWIIGWVVRGFVGIPMGQDRKSNL